MKRINKKIRISHLIVLNFVYFIILFFLYNYLKTVVENSGNDINIIFSGISIVFMIAGLSVVSLSFIVFVYLKKQNDNLLEDIENLSEHIQDISSKKYDSNIKIKYYEDFLKISLSLKNIVKRLNKKD